MPKADIEVVLPFSLWDEVIDSISTDVSRLTGESIGRRSEAWTMTRRGRGHRLTTRVGYDAGWYIAEYLISRVGLSEAFEPKYRAAARASEKTGLRIAMGLIDQLKVAKPSH